MFPDGIYYDVKNHQYLTIKVNSFVELVKTMSNSYGGTLKKTLLANEEVSFWAPPAGLEPATL